MPVRLDLCRILRVVWLVLASALLASPALAERRVALVIGNGAYKNVPVLANPINDAADISVALRRLGFEVQQATNLTYDGMRQNLRDFNRRADGADIVLVYFAGHGMEVGGENWLIPVDAQLKSDRDIDIESIGMRSLLSSIEGAGKLGMVILDACRNNPFANQMQRSNRTRTVGRGLASIEPVGNVLVAYAAKDGTTAADGEGRNSPFTKSLLSHIETPGLEINFLFRNVRDDVIMATRREQQPFVYGSLSRDAIYLKAALPVEPVPAGPPPDQMAWSFLKDTSDPAALKRFVEQFPSSSLRQEAEARMVALIKQQSEATKAFEQRMASLAAEAQEAKSRPVGPAPEDVAWDLIRESKDANQFQLFVKQFPKSPRAREAQQRTAALTEEQRSTSAAMDKRLATIEAEQRAATAALEKRLAALAAEAQKAKTPAGPAPEDVAWNLVKDSKDQNQFKLFLQQFPQSPRRGDAEKRLTTIEAEQQAATAALEQRMAALSKEAMPSSPDPGEMARLLQFELQRVGCFTGAVNGEFNAPTRTALQNFAKLASINVPDELNIDTLKTLRGIDKRVCPPACKAGERAEGDRCVAIAKPEPAEKRASAPAAPRKPAAGGGGGGGRGGGGGKGGKCFNFNGRTFCE